MLLGIRGEPSISPGTSCLASNNKLDLLLLKTSTKAEHAALQGVVCDKCRNGKNKLTTKSVVGCSSNEVIVIFLGMSSSAHP